MRQDYIHRFYDDFSETGFKRLIGEGFLFKNAKYNYIPTKTGPGHASIYTSTTPSRHGIVGNDWYERGIKRRYNCVEDTTVSVVGGVSNGEVSAANVRVTTVTDELRLYHNFESKVIGISLKDRGAAIPAGHNPTGAYWYDLQSGNMITSTYYRDELPDWVTRYNQKKRYESLLGQDWNLFADESVYNESIKDDNAYEQELRKGMGVSFPHQTSKYKKDPSLIKYTPYTNTIIKEVAMEAISNEELGKDAITDFLTISFSATDDIGHKFGPRSKEVQDIYLRLDAEMAEILDALDREVGEGNYLVFLTADHGSTDVPSYLYKNKMPAGYHNNKFIKDLINDELSSFYGDEKWVDNIINEQVFLDQQLIKSKSLDLEEVRQVVVNRLLKEDYVEEAFSSTLVAKRIFTDPYLQFLQNGYYGKRCGDVVYILSNSNLNDAYGRQGTDHRTGYSYDRHIPIIFFGAGIPTGSSIRPVSITDIAPTLSHLLNISLPSGSTGEPLLELFD
ncbi:MAG: alkaline phosphatase family protein [Ekhidna sp.]